MLKSKIEFQYGRPYIKIDGELHAPLAYTAYFEECAEYSDFIKSGYKMFFVNVSFTDLPINNFTGFTPFLTGVFEGNCPDYSEFDGTVNRILAECPDAFVFPRINIAMPSKWIESNPYETVETPTGRRESLYSDLFKRDGACLLKELVSHIRSASYADRIAGYQLCGGTTQEWMHHDLSGSFSEMGTEKFRNWMKKKYGITDVPAFTKEDLNKISRYGEFCCEEAAKTVEYFARALKEHINGEQVAGVFYGYNAFVNNPLWGLHGLRFIIDSPYIDFFSSPCCYDENRNLGFDWGDMLTAQSVKEHGKLYFVECDIRTHLTRRLHDSRPGRYRDGIYELHDDNGNKTVWCGPETSELSISAIRKAFAHQLTKASGIWWFDMWGGWYHSDEIMSEMAKMCLIAEGAKNKNAKKYPSAETVLFIDEKAYLNNPTCSPLCHAVNHTRIRMGNSGIPFDLCLVEDAEKVIKNYRAAIFTAPLPTDSGKEAIELCEKLNIPYLHTSEEKPFYSVDEVRDFLVASGVHCYNPDGNVIYCGEGFFAVHSVNDGEVKITLPQKYKIKPLLGTDIGECETDTLTLNMKKYETAVWEMFEIENIL